MARPAVAARPGGGLAHFPAPKTYNANDIELVADTPVFATSKRALVYIKARDIDEVETEMMAVKWRQFTLHSPIPVSEQQQIHPVVPVSPNSFSITCKYESLIVCRINAWPI